MNQGAEFRFTLVDAPHNNAIQSIQIKEYDDLIVLEVNVDNHDNYEGKLPSIIVITASKSYAFSTDDTLHNLLH